MLALALLLAVSIPALFLNLEGGEMFIYDEGLYGHLARHMVTYREWLYAVNPDGLYGVGLPKFSKPPLSLWAVVGAYKVLGPSMFALRFPFALCDLLTVAVCFAWGRRIGGQRLGPWLGLAWGAAVAVSGFTMVHGRRATIDVMLTAFGVAALLFHAIAVETRTRKTYLWAFASGVALAFAFMTKQLAVAYVAVPIVLLEVVYLFYEGFGRPVLRLTIAAFVPLAIGGTWTVLAYREVGMKLVEVMFDHSIATRLGGFDGLLHYRHLNRVADALDEIAAPFSWELGAAGVVLMLAVLARRSREDGAPPNGAWLLPLTAGFMTLLLENISGTTIAWYQCTFAPVVMAGVAWTVTHAFAAIVRWVRERNAEPTASEALHVGLGVAVLLSAAVRAAHPAMSQLNLVTILLLAPVVGLLLARGRRFGESRALRVSSLVGISLAVLGLGFGVARHDEFRQGVPWPEEMMRIVGRERPKRVSVDVRYRPRHYEMTTFFDTLAERTPAPWDSRAETPELYDARVEMMTPPAEIGLRPGVRMDRASGAVVLFGQLLRPPFLESSLKKTLASGRPLTFEAEHLRTERPSSLVSDANASGGLARTVDPWLNSLVEAHWLSRGTGFPVPKGSYTAVFYVNWDCDVAQNVRVGSVQVENRKRSIRCKDAKPDPDEAYQRIVIPFQMRSEGELSISVNYDRGLLSHDRTEIWRRGAYRGD